MPDPIRALPVDDRDAQALFRALLQYETILKYSALSDSALVAEELHRVVVLQERISLSSFYPAEDYDRPQDGDWPHVEEEAA